MIIKIGFLLTILGLILGLTGSIILLNIYHIKTLDSFFAMQTVSAKGTTTITPSQIEVDTARYSHGLTWLLVGFAIQLIGTVIQEIWPKLVVKL